MSGCSTQAGQASVSAPQTPSRLAGEAGIQGSLGAHLTPGSRRRCRVPEEAGHIPQGLGGSSTGFEQALASWVLGKTPKRPQASGQAGPGLADGASQSGPDPSWRASRCQTPATHSWRSQVLGSHEGIDQSLRPRPCPLIALLPRAGLPCPFLHCPFHGDIRSS